MNGIKKRWVRNYIIVIFIAMLLIEGSFLVVIRKYYYESIEQNLINRAKISAGFYHKYLNDGTNTFENIAKQIIEDFSYNKYAELQIIDVDGNILLSSNNFGSKEIVNTEDFFHALQGKTLSWRGKNINTSEELMSVSTPLKYGENKVVGVLRYVTSLEKVNEMINRVFIISLLVAGSIIIILLILSMIFSKSIINPINSITIVAKKMAKGQFSERIEKKYNDEIGEVADTLNYMADEIVKGQKLKNDFISSISHELRTPLTSIRGWSETILTGNLEGKEEVKRGLKVIVKETLRLSEMVEELLDFSKIENGKMVLNLEKVNIKNELEEIIHIFKLRALKKGLKVDYICTEDIPMIMGDKNRLRQVFINVFDNAVKFSEEGKAITCKIYVNGKNIYVEIKDEGIGIVEEDLSRIKEKFYKGNIQKPGSGLGLAISDDIIKLHGGSLEIESKIGKGTKVKIVLPV